MFQDHSFMIKFNKILITFFLSIFFVIIMLSPLTKCKSSYDGKAVIIGDDYVEEFENLYDAISFAEVGSTIFVGSGIFYENFVIDKPITLIGNNSNDTIIDGQGNDFIIIVEACCVNISNFTFKNATMGLFIKNSEVLVKNNLFSNNSNGIFLNNLSNNGIIEDNFFISNSEAINLYGSSNNILSGNHFGKNSFFSVKLMEGSNNNTIFNNTIVSGKNGIAISRWSNGNSIINNNITTDLWGVGVSCDFSFLNSIQDNYFSNWTRGIELFKSENNSIKNNSFVRNNLGVFLSDDDVNFIFDDNYFFENGEDLKTVSKPPIIKVPSIEITILIVVAFVVLLVFFLKPKKN